MIANGLRCVAALVCCLLLAGCASDEHTDIKQWMKDSTKDLRGRVPPLPEVKPFPVVSYDAMDVVDPFQPSRIEPEKKAAGVGVKGPPDLDPNLHPLIKYPLESLRFVGILRKEKMLYAAVLADRKIYQAKIGSYMGQNYGMVSDIQTSPGMDEARLVLRELVQDSSGDWVERVTNFEMQAMPAQETKK
jgi:type IV pilus assembly protein PilP